MEYVLGLVTFIIIVQLLAWWKFPHKVTLGEVAIGVVGLSFLISVLYYAGTYKDIQDTQVLNGFITKKYSEKVSCEHSYSCNCITTCSGGKTPVCTTTCQTCYEHDYDKNWVVNSTAGNFSIARVDRQGLKTPPRWEAVKIGEPASREYSYSNYIKAAPESIFHLSSSKLESQPMVDYPRVFDYYRIMRVINFGVKIPEKEHIALNDAMNIMNGKVGPAKQVNTVLILHNKDEAFVESVRYRWLGGRKNDVVVLLKVSEYPKIDSASVFSWSSNEILNVALRDSIMQIGEVRSEEIALAFEENIKRHFKRRSMEEFEYLLDSIEPPTWVIVITLLLGLFGPFVTAYIFYKYDVFH